MEAKQRHQLIEKILSKKENRTQFINEYIAQYDKNIILEKKLEASTNAIFDAQKFLLQLRASLYAMVSDVKYLDDTIDQKVKDMSLSSAQAKAFGLENRLLSMMRKYYKEKDFSMAEEEKQGMFNSFEAYLQDCGNCEYMLGIFESAKTYGQGLKELYTTASINQDNMFNLLNTLSSKIRDIQGAKNLREVGVIAKSATELINIGLNTKKAEVKYSFFEDRTPGPDFKMNYDM